MGDPGFIRKLLSTPKLRSGAFVELPHVTYSTARRVQACAETTVPIETEGEVIGSLPATFELIGERLKVIA